jgi:catechol 2,3-dioxygenase-like lactoylglutathione lyase family enzyme
MTPPAVAFSHIGIYVTDLPAMERFYIRRLGFVVTDRGDLDTPWYVTQPMRVPIDLSLSDAVLMERLEALARRQPSFKPHAAWRAEMADRLGRPGT